MFQGEASGPSGPGFSRRLARLTGAWLYFCGWRAATLTAELFSPARFKARLRRARPDKTGRRAGRSRRN